MLIGKGHFGSAVWSVQRGFLSHILSCIAPTHERDSRKDNPAGASGKEKDRSKKKEGRRKR